ncbi:MAG: glucose-6-phosphate dehydrogenase [Bacteriovoracaceae bacterium]|nr:glucose-6-phosphate dehydrogenase [Bacteriovoracaceae bacterium]
MDNLIKDDLIIVIFGATGDLTKRKLIPALVKLFSNNTKNVEVPIICISRSDMSNEEFYQRLEMKKYIPKITDTEYESFTKKIKYHALDFSDNCDPGSCRDCNRCNELAIALDVADAPNPYKKTIIFYLATPPKAFENISRIIQKTLPPQCQLNMKIAFEKPFGLNLKSSQQLNHSIGAIFKEEQIFRVDHYLGKALVQDMLLFRFSNLLFEQVWSSKFIDNIQITIAEAIGVEYRAGYYDKTGAIKDMLQNHLMQLLSLTTMDEPQSFEANHVRHEMSKVLKTLKLPSAEDIVIGQYKNSSNDNVVSSYTDEPNVPDESKTETFFAMKMELDNDKWRGVPIYVRSGKKLKNTFAEINLVLKDVSCKLFLKGSCEQNTPNTISIRIQPNTGIALSFNIKRPGPGLAIMPVNMDFCHHCLFNINTPDAYEAVFGAIISGDQTIFTSWDSIESSWKYTDYILELIKNRSPSFYDPGSRGPQEADQLLEATGRKWLN